MKVNVHWTVANADYHRRSDVQHVYPEVLAGHVPCLVKNADRPGIVARVRERVTEGGDIPLKHLRHQVYAPEERPGREVEE